MLDLNLVGLIATALFLIFINCCCMFLGTVGILVIFKFLVGRNLGYI